MRLLRIHLKRYGTGREGRVFTLARGGVLADRAYLAVFQKARAAAFIEQEDASPQVAEWAGHSVDVLLRVCVKCISGHRDEAKRRILEATQPPRPKRA